MKWSPLERKKAKEIKKVFGEARKISRVDAYLEIEAREEFFRKYEYISKKRLLLYSEPENRKVVFGDSLIEKMIEKNWEADVYLFPFLHEIAHIVDDVNTSYEGAGFIDTEQWAMKKAYEWLVEAKGEEEALEITRKGIGGSIEYAEKWLPFLKDRLFPEDYEASGL